MKYKFQRNVVCVLKNLHRTAFGCIALLMVSGVANAEEVVGFPYTLINPDTVGGTGAPNVSWSMSGVPTTGLSSVSIQIVPTLVAQRDQNSIFWAYSSWFKSGDGWYIGIQPNPKGTPKVLFSVFGTGSRGLDAATCADGADGGAGTHCHLPYPWSVGTSYTLQTQLIGQSDTEMTWQGSIRNDSTGVRTTIGTIAVTKNHGFLKSSGITFTEFYARSMPCDQRPLSETIFHTLVGNVNNTNYPGKIQKVNANGGAGGCNPKFYSDHSTYVYLRQGSNY
jgi:hypothetical protein